MIQPSGARWWRLRYRFEGREQALSLGTYPDVSLKQARDRRDAARKLVADNINPSEVRQEERRRLRDTFEAVAKEWASEQPWAPVTRTKNERVLKYLNAEIGTRPVSKITTAVAYDALKRISERGPHVGPDGLPDHERRDAHGHGAEAGRAEPRDGTQQAHANAGFLARVFWYIGTRSEHRGT